MVCEIMECGGKVQRRRRFRTDKDRRKFKKGSRVTALPELRSAVLPSARFSGEPKNLPVRRPALRGSGTRHPTFRSLEVQSAHPSPGGIWRQTRNVQRLNEDVKR